MGSLVQAFLRGADIEAFIKDTTVDLTLDHSIEKYKVLYQAEVAHFASPLDVFGYIITGGYKVSLGSTKGDTGNIKLYIMLGRTRHAVGVVLTGPPTVNLSTDYFKQLVATTDLGTLTYPTSNINILDANSTATSIVGVTVGDPVFLTVAVDITNTSGNDAKEYTLRLAPFQLKLNLVSLDRF